MQNKSPSRNIQENWNYKLVNYMWTVFSVSQSGLLKSVVISEACKVEGVIHILSNLLYMSVVLNCVNTAWNIMILNLVACKVFVHTQMCQQSTQIQISRADSSCLFKYFSPCWRFEFGTVFACCATRFSPVHARLLVVMSQYVNSLHHSVRRRIFNPEVILGWNH